ncbi:MAG: hypothetical protein WC455_29490 [Dehalococcoidia bacterium]|jgi:hypothetical protein
MSAEEDKKETLSWAGGRKYVLVVAGFLVASAALFFKKSIGIPYATFSEWTMFVLADFGFYFSVNYAQKKAENVMTVETAKVASVAEVAKIEAEK